MSTAYSDITLRSVLEQPLPLISVIIPVYNKAQFVEESVSSVINQSYPNLEILLRDDGSTDNSLAILNALPNKFPNVRFKIFTDQNKGASYSRNFLIEKACSQIMILMDGDDIMLPGFINAALHTFRTSDARVVYSNVALTGASATEWVPPIFDQYTIRYGNCLTSLVMIDKALWIEAGGYDLSLPFNEDWSFFIRAAQKTRGFYRLPEKYFIYRQTSSGLYHSFILDNWSCNLSMVTLANPDLYAVEEVLEAVNNLKKMPPHWPNKLSLQSQKFPERYLPYLLLGIAALSRNDRAKYLEFIQKSVETSQAKEWVPLFLLGELLEQSEPQNAITYYHHARTARPDLNKLLNDRITALLNGIKSQSHKEGAIS